MTDDGDRGDGGNGDHGRNGDAESAGADDADDGDDTRFEPDPERVVLLREVAADVRGDSSESQQLAAILYRVSDLYDESEETTPEEIYRNVRFIMQVNERGGLDR